MLLGADAYITKPYTNEKLVAQVRELLENNCEETAK